MAKLKRKLGTRITVIVVALLMVLTVGLLGACNITDTLQEGLDALQADVVYLYNNGGATEEQLDEKQERIDEFRNGSNGTLTPAQKEQLDKVQGKVDYMRNGGNAMRHPNSYTNIDVEIENRIRQDFVAQSPMVDTIAEVWLRYLGTYDESVVIHPQGDFVGNLPPAMETEVVAGFEFWTNTGNPILVWRNGVFYTLTAAFDNNYLTTDDMPVIYDLWQA